MPYLDKKAILDSLTQDDVTKVVLALGSNEPKKDRNGALIFQTICHNKPDPSNSYKLYYYHEPDEEKGYKGRTFKCYSGCGGECFSIIELVIRAKRNQGITFNWYKALYFIGKTTGKLIESSPDKQEAQIITDFEWINRFKRIKNKKNRAVPQLTGINENILEIYCYLPHEEWLKDNISMEALSQFEIGYDGEHDAITIPHREWKNGDLVGLRLRYLSKEDIEKIGKYVPAQVEGKFLSHQLGSNLYGLHIAKDTVQRKKKIMLVEAEKSVLQSYSYYGDDSFTVATCGSAITPTQIKILLSELKVEEMIYAPDRDYHDADSYEAEIWYNKQIRKLAPLIPYVKVSLLVDDKDRLGYKDSPTDRGKEVLEELLEEKIIVDMEQLKMVEEGINIDE